jgi:hypothetical protein
MAFVSAPQLTVTTANAQALCSEPIIPTCVELSLTYDSEGSIERCEIDLQRYGDELNAYADCIDQRLAELEELHEDALREFSCRSGKGDDCP